MTDKRRAYYNRLTSTEQRRRWLRHQGYTVPPHLLPDPDDEGESSYIRTENWVHRFTAWVASLGRGES